MRKVLRLGSYAVIAALGIVGSLRAETRGPYPVQKQYQKDGRPEAGAEDEVPEAGAEDEPQGGYAAPPRSGTMAGPTSSLGLDGLELEIPALKLKLPKVRFPSFTRYHTQPRMLVDEAVAPFVRNFREEFSVEAGKKPEAGREDDLPGPAAPEAGGEDEPGQKPTQKSKYGIGPAQVMQQQERLEARIRELEELLAAASRVDARFRQGESSSYRRVPDVERPAREPRQPEPLPTVSTVSPASFQAPAYAIARLPVGEALPADRRAAANESELAEIREMIVALQRQQAAMHQQMLQQQLAASAAGRPYETSRDWQSRSSHADPSRIPVRLPRVVR